MGPPEPAAGARATLTRSLISPRKEQPRCQPLTLTAHMTGVFQGGGGKPPPPPPPSLHTHVHAHMHTCTRRHTRTCTHTTNFSGGLHHSDTLALEAQQGMKTISKNRQIRVQMLVDLELGLSYLANKASARTVEFQINIDCFFGIRMGHASLKFKLSWVPCIPAVSCPLWGWGTDPL